MKSLSSSKIMLAALGLTVMVLATPAVAQTVGLRVDAPFAFTAGSQDFAPGHYWFNVDINRMQLTIHSRTTTATSVVRLAPGGVMKDATKPDTGMLRFEKWGSRYFLVGIWRPGTYEWNNVVPSRRLMESAKAEAGPAASASYVNLR
ncbi:MAG: hypothetical protein ACLQVN_11910 [Bryobacteraceae bacterium]